MKIYSVIGTNTEVIDLTSNHSSPDDHIKMTGPRPTPEHVAQPDGTWIIPEPTPAEKAASVRGERNARLDDIDKAINKAEDNGNMALAAQLRQDRQALRDVPNQPGFPDDVIWP